MSVEHSIITRHLSNVIQFNYFIQEKERIRERMCESNIFLRHFKLTSSNLTWLYANFKLQSSWEMLRLVSYSSWSVLNHYPCNMTQLFRQEMLCFLFFLFVTARAFRVWKVSNTIGGIVQLALQESYSFCPTKWCIQILFIVNSMTTLFSLSSLHGV